MTWRIRNAMAAACLALCLAACDDGGSDTFTTVPSGDTEMAAAMVKARQTLPEFWRHHSNPKPGMSGFAVKVGISDPEKDYEEFFWIGKISKEKDGQLSGTIDNDPQGVSSAKAGQRYRFVEKRIVDWLYMHNEKMAGNYTLRPLLKRMPKEQADKLRAILQNP